jgi:hypothetical protein
VRVTVVSAFHPPVIFERPPRTVRIDLDCPSDCSPKATPNESFPAENAVKRRAEGLGASYYTSDCCLRATVSKLDAC